MINICIACPCRDDREAMIAVLGKQDDFRIACIAEDGFDVITSVIARRPDVIIMDYNLKNIESPVLAPVLRRKSPSTALIMLCSQEERVPVELCLKAGISGYLIKQGGFDNLAASVRSVYYGGLYISAPVGDEVLNGFSACQAIREPKNKKTPVFLQTELGILSGIVRGHTDAEIASNLNINTGTLRNYVSRVKKKTCLKNRTQIIIYALLHGLIQIGNEFEQCAA